MLSFILGRAGSGKTTAVLQKIAQAAGEKKRVLLIVPEQFSFEMEKAVARLVPNGAQQVEVYSFTRLCHKIFADCGGMAGEVVTEPAKQILMSLTLGQVRDQLELYSRQAKNPAFVGTMLRQIDEFKNAGVLPDQLRLFSRRPPAAAGAEDKGDVPDLRVLSGAAGEPVSGREGLDHALLCAVGGQGIFSGLRHLCRFLHDLYGRGEKAAAADACRVRAHGGQPSAGRPA